MPTTYTNIATTTLTGYSNSVVFSSIPQTYTDLAIRMCARGFQSNIGAQMTISTNATSNLASWTDIWTVGGAPGSGGTSTLSGWNGSTGYWATGANATANTFGNAEFYFPSYSVTNLNKTVFFWGMAGNSSASQWRIGILGGLQNSNTAINSITINAAAGGGFSSGTFYLYGIKNS